MFRRSRLSDFDIELTFVDETQTPTSIEPKNDKNLEDPLLFGNKHVKLKGKGNKRKGKKIKLDLPMTANVSKNAKILKRDAKKKIQKQGSKSEENTKKDVLEKSEKKKSGLFRVLSGRSKKESFSEEEEVSSVKNPFFKFNHKSKNVSLGLKGNDKTEEVKKSRSVRQSMKTITGDMFHMFKKKGVIEEKEEVAEPEKKSIRRNTLS